MPFFTFSDEELKMLKEVLELDEIEEFVTEELDEGEWTEEDLSNLNKALVKLGVEEIEYGADAGD